MPDKPFSHFEGTDDELLALVSENFSRAKAGYKDGVLEVPVPADRFRSAVTPLEVGQTLTANYAARREGEDPFLTVNVVGPKAPAKEVKIILYRRDVLGADATTDADYEVISLNASVQEGGEPMTPMAMARNFLGLAGGTKADYTAEQFAKAIVFWDVVFIDADHTFAHVVQDCRLWEGRTRLLTGHDYSPPNHDVMRAVDLLYRGRFRVLPDTSWVVPC